MVAYVIIRLMPKHAVKEVFPLGRALGHPMEHNDQTASETRVWRSSAVASPVVMAFLGKVMTRHYNRVTLRSQRKRRAMKILAISDVVLDLLHSPLVTKRFGDVDMVLGCGDLPVAYMEYIVSMLNKPFYFVYGNHAQHVIITESGPKIRVPEGCINIHRRVINHDGLLIAGLEGSMRYREGPHQYHDWQMALNVAFMLPRLWWNRLVRGRAVDILVTHSAPFGIHDGKDLCHRGFRVFLPFMERFKPLYLVHGHTHLYRQDATRITQFEATTVINAFGYQVIEFDEAKLFEPR